MRATAISRAELMWTTAILMTATAGLAARGLTHSVPIAAKILYYVITANR